MPTLRQYASRIANITGHTADHALSERVKDAFKNIFATRIRQSVSANGIDRLFLLTLETVITADFSNISGFSRFTVGKIPVPVRFKNDAPFVYVGFEDGVSFSFKNPIEIKLASKYGGNGFLRYYTYDNGYMDLYLTESYGDLEYGEVPEKVLIRTIFENPEEIISVIDGIDAQDVELPFPNDMLESIILELLKTEFNYIAPELEIKS